MSVDIWYFSKGEITVGPLTLAELIAVLKEQSDPMHTYVSDGTIDWTQVCDIPELCHHFKKPPPGLKLLVSKISLLSVTTLKLLGVSLKLSEPELSILRVDERKAGWSLKASFVGALGFIAIVIVGAFGVGLGQDIVRGVRERSAVKQLQEGLGTDTVQTIKDRSATEQLHNELKMALPSLRTALPKKIDDLTTMIAVDATDEWLMHYFRVNGEFEDFKGVNFGSEMRSLFVPAACKEAQFRITLAKGAKYQFLYSDRNGRLIGSFVMDKNDCQL